MNIAYVRVSTTEQNDQRQIQELEKYNIDKWFNEKVSAKDTNRPQLKNMLELAANFYEFNKQLDDDKKQKLTIYIKDFSRLARSTKDLLEIIDELDKKGVGVVSLKESLDTSTSTGKLMLTMIGAINEFERANLLERQKEGISIAKKNGVYKGRKKIEMPKNFQEVYSKWKNRELTGNKAMELLGLKRNTFYKLIKEYESKVGYGNKR